MSLSRRLCRTYPFGCLLLGGGSGSSRSAAGSLPSPVKVVSMFATRLRNRTTKYVHDVTADEGDTDHESPAGNLGEAPDSIADGDVEAVLSERAVEGVEEALVRCGLLVGLLEVDGGDLRSGDGGAVE